MSFILNLYLECLFFYESIYSEKSIYSESSNIEDYNY